MKLLKYLFLSILLIPVLTFAAATPPGGETTVTNVDAIENFTITDIYNRLISGVNWFLAFVAIIAVAVLIYSGFLFMTAGGEEDALSSAKEYLKYSLIGLAIAILAFSVVNIVQNFLV